jgi:amino acid permease
MLSITIIIKSIIGAGIISLPYTMSRLGYLFTIAVFLVFGTLNQLCCSLLLRAKNLSGHSNYSTIMGYIWGNTLSKFFGSLIIFLDNFGTCNPLITEACCS